MPINSSFKKSKFSKNYIIIFVILFTIYFLNHNFFTICDASISWQTDFQEAATPSMEGIVNFNHTLSFVIIFIITFVSWLILNTIYFYLESVNTVPTKFTHSNELEIVWTSIPAIILLFLATPSFSLLYSMDEISDITDYIQDEAGSSADVIWGHAYDETLGNNISVTLIATGFKMTPDTGLPAKAPEKKKMHLMDENTVEVKAPIQNPVNNTPPTIENVWSNTSFTNESINEATELENTIQPTINETIINYLYLNSYSI